MAEQLPVWLNAGVEPPESLKTGGWEPGMKPSAQHMNWLLNRTYNVLKALQANSDLTQIEQELSELETEFTQHSGDKIAHITSQERTKWNTALQPSTYSATNTIMNIGGGYSSRVFPTISWSGGGPELWETAMVVPEGGIWGVLEIEIAGYSASSGGARVLVEMGINAQVTGPSTQFGLDFKILQMSSRFAANFYVDFEHRPEARTILVKVYKRTYNDLITLKLNLLLNTRGMTAFQMLQRFNGGSFYNSAAPTTAIQQDLFTSVSNGKTAVASAISDGGVYTSPIASFADMANNIRQLASSGYKMATGSSPNVQVVLDVPAGTFGFTPKVILTRALGSAYLWATQYIKADAFYPGSVGMGETSARDLSGSTDYVDETYGSTILRAGGFRINATTANTYPVGGTAVTWWAFG